MTLRRTILILALGLLVAAPATASTGLVGQSGPGFQITMKRNGKTLKTIRAGTYTIKIEDKSSAHNFRLRGPGVNKTTSVSAKGTFTWKVRLKRGTYKYVCDPHASFMKGSFTVK
jgi:plastocyanin